VIQELSYLQSEGVIRQGVDPLRQADHSAHGWQESLQIDRLKVEAGEAELLSQREGPKCFDTRPRLVIKLAAPAWRGAVMASRA